MHRAHRHLRAALGVDEALGLRFFRGLLQRNAAAPIPLKHLRDDRSYNRVRRDDLLAIGVGDIAVAKRRFGRPDTLLGLFLLALAGLLRQVVDVVLGHQHLDAVHELFRGPRLTR